MLTVDFINVGYGDSILIREFIDDSTSFNMLVDCGDLTIDNRSHLSKRITASDFLRKEKIETLDLFVLTHLHLDHCGGLQQLLQKVKIKNFWTNYLPPEEFWGKHTKIPEQISPGASCLIQAMNIYSAALQTLEKQGTKMCCVRK